MRTDTIVLLSLCVLRCLCACSAASLSTGRHQLPPQPSVTASEPPASPPPAAPQEFVPAPVAPVPSPDVRPSAPARDLGRQSSFMSPAGEINCIYTARGGTAIYMPMGGGPEISCDRSVQGKYERVYLGGQGAAQIVKRPGDASCCGVEPVLEEGSHLERGPYRCATTQGQIACRRDDGHGFVIGGPRVRLLGPRDAFGAPEVAEKLSFEPFDPHPPEAKVRQWIAGIRVKQSSVPAALRAQADAILAAEPSNEWVSVIIELVVEPSASVASMSAARNVMLEVARRAGARDLSQLESQPVVSFSVHRRVLEALLRTGIVRSVSANQAIPLGDCTKGC